MEVRSCRYILATSYLGRQKRRNDVHKIIRWAAEEVQQLESALKHVDAFLEKAPEGCLKWQNRNGKTYYYHQFKKENKWQRNFIRKEDIALAKLFAQKHYYIAIRPILKRKLKVLKSFLENYSIHELEKVYEELSPERKTLVKPLQFSVNEKLEKWEQEVYEKNMMYSENLRYKTEQGDMVRSKSEVIIANIMYHHRKDILYKYERPLELMDRTRKKVIYPDFTIINKHTGEITYWEHAGRLDDPQYANEFVKKLNTYIANDLLPGRDVIISVETQNTPLDIRAVQKLVEQVIRGN